MLPMVNATLSWGALSAMDCGNVITVFGKYANSVQEFRCTPNPTGASPLVNPALQTYTVHLVFRGRAEVLQNILGELTPKSVVDAAGR